MRYNLTYTVVWVNLLLLMKDILTFIPQRPPFVMVDELISVDEKIGITRYKVRADHIFFLNGKLTEPALIENIAQTAAARVGYICSQENTPVPIGFIGAVQHLQILDLPEADDEIETKIEIKHQVFDVTLIQGSVSCKNKLLAQCEMKIFIQSTNNSTII